METGDMPAHHEAVYKDAVDNIRFVKRQHGTRGLVFL
jgi:hypothetical protein